MSFDSLMNIVVSIEQSTLTDTRRGGVTKSWSNRFANVPVRVQPMSGKEALLYGSERTPVTHHMFVSADYDGIIEGDRVAYGSRVFEIQLVRNIDFMDHHLELVLRELKQDI